MVAFLNFFAFNQPILAESARIRADFYSWVPGDADPAPDFQVRTGIDGIHQYNRQMDRRDNGDPV